ncbi:uncharacterized protein B0P05DRAFT_593455 [Gilbertella persicaria]|uniref:uncharacterized protein n=1 Tax=Gilbertella persicaria TaxID=101096 RepID=UPI00221E61B8|nr:uncharacterized protein B0P05DRAFT_593455 [Gilbertella persicaria]KAI8098084.1 hypothetical protein B0P05DRAFT_593455 [Gilbertella persicaria]
MGLLKLGSIYKKKSKKEPIIDQPPTPIAPKLEPLSLELNLNSIATIDSNTSSKPDNNNNNNSKAPAGTGSFMEDIFSQLDTKPSQNKDPLHQDFSLALALSQQLGLEDVKPSTTKSAPAKKTTPAASNNDFLLGNDSIYSSYLRAMDSDNQHSSSFGTSMFDHLLTKNNTTTYHRETQPQPQQPPPPPPTTQVVLDSDVSDSDEASEHSEDSASKEQASYRMTKGVRPIMERRAQDNRLLVQRKVDNWSKQVDPDAKLVETNESIINRMKDRHRNQVKMAALRQQQQQQQQMGHPHMVPQAYGMPLSQNNMVLPHPGMLMDPVHSMYYPQPEFPADYNTVMPPVPTSFMPHPAHAAPSSPPPREEMESYKPTIALSKSMSTPTIQRKTDRSAMMSLPNHSSSSDSNHISTDTDSMVAESPIPVEETPSLEDQSAAEEADAESSDDEERRSITLRKQKSKKQRQKSAETELSDTRANYRQVRSSRSAPNLKKNKKKKSSTASSRRNSQELSITSTPPSETVMTPPRPPLPNTFAQAMMEEDPNHGVPRSNSHHQMMQPHRHTLRHMKSEPELPKRNIQYQQQLNYEWERMQIHQREQQLKSQYQSKFNTSQQQQQQQQSYMAMYAPVYYPTARMPYSMDSHQDHRASQMSMNNPMVYQPNYYPHHR